MVALAMPWLQKMSGAATAPVPLVVRSLLPSVTAAVRFPHAQFPPRSSGSLPQQIADPAADNIMGQAKAYQNSVQNVAV